jgi:ATP-dependent DNA ligase
MRKKPMLAYPASAKPIDYSKPTFVQPKLDGVRCVIQCDGNPAKRGIVAFSRTGKEWKNIDHILEQLIPFFIKYPYVILDGELYNHDLRDNFEKIISLVRKTKPTDEDRLEASKLTQFHCYDIIDEKLPFDQRNEFINQSLMLLGDSIYIVDTRDIFDEKMASAFHKVNLKEGYEGSIVRTNDTYQCKRSHNLRKFKDFSDAEATIVGFVEGKGKRVGTLGKFIMKDDDGNEFGCPPGKGYNYEDMKKLLYRAKWYVNHKARATFTYFERTKAGSYRHPLFKTIRDYE